MCPLDRRTSTKGDRSQSTEESKAEVRGLAAGSSKEGQGEGEGRGPEDDGREGQGEGEDRGPEDDGREGQGEGKGRGPEDDGREGQGEGEDRGPEDDGREGFSAREGCVEEAGVPKRCLFTDGEGTPLRQRRRTLRER
ncbi:high mobility group nucleosome-binding domain-containing protein 5 [Palaemon carinicauda]|uniref:high mobility group nucleosome-binding domain-containing protein 5 n=1 Tax=Palaemon carinicauda TaxID=392227 RepID=UPI0035B6935B